MLEINHSYELPNQGRTTVINTYNSNFLKDNVWLSKRCIKQISDSKVARSMAFIWYCGTAHVYTCDSTDLQVHETYGVVKRWADIITRDFVSNSVLFCEICIIIKYSVKITDISSRTLKCRLHFILITLFLFTCSSLIHICLTCGHLVSRVSSEYFIFNYEG